LILLTAKPAYWENRKVSGSIIVHIAGFVRGIYTVFSSPCPLLSAADSDLKKNSFQFSAAACLLKDGLSPESDRRTKTD